MFPQNHISNIEQNAVTYQQPTSLFSKLEGMLPSLLESGGKVMEYAKTKRKKLAKNSYEYVAEKTDDAGTHINEFFRLWGQTESTGNKVKSFIKHNENELNDPNSNLSKIKSGVEHINGIGGLVMAGGRAASYMIGGAGALSVLGITSLPIVAVASSYAILQVASVGLTLLKDSEKVLNFPTFWKPTVKYGIRRFSEKRRDTEIHSSYFGEEKKIHEDEMKRLTLLLEKFETQLLFENNELENFQYTDVTREANKKSIQLIEKKIERTKKLLGIETRRKLKIERLDKNLGDENKHVKSVSRYKYQLEGANSDDLDYENQNSYILDFKNKINQNKKGIEKTEEETEVLISSIISKMKNILNDNDIENKEKLIKNNNLHNNKIFKMLLEGKEETKIKENFKKLIETNKIYKSEFEFLNGIISITKNDFEKILEQQTKKKEYEEVIKYNEKEIFKAEEKSKGWETLLSEAVKEGIITEGTKNFKQVDYKSRRNIRRLVRDQIKEQIREQEVFYKSEVQLEMLQINKLESTEITAYLKNLLDKNKCETYEELVEKNIPNLPRKEYFIKAEKRIEQIEILEKPIKKQHELYKEKEENFSKRSERERIIKEIEKNDLLLEELYKDQENGKNRENLLKPNEGRFREFIEIKALKELTGNPLIETALKLFNIEPKLYKDYVKKYMFKQNSLKISQDIKSVLFKIFGETLNIDKSNENNIMMNEDYKKDKDLSKEEMTYDFLDKYVNLSDRLLTIKNFRVDKMNKKDREVKRVVSKKYKELKSDAGESIEDIKNLIMKSIQEVDELINPNQNHQVRASTEQVQNNNLEM